MKIIIAPLIILTLIISCNNENKSTEQNISGKTDSKHTPKIHILSGNGIQVRSVELKAGLAVFKSEYEGKKNFAVTLKDFNENDIELLVSTIDEYSGSKSVKIVNSGIYILDITAFGKWEIRIEN